MSDDLLPDTPSDIEPDITIGVLAGGKSRRMKTDKAWLELNGKPLIRHVLDRLGEADVLISANDDRYDSLKLPRVPDILNGGGPLVGIHALLRALPETANPWLFVVACDMPFVNLKLMEHLKEKARGLNSGVVVARSERGPEPLHGLYSRLTIPAIEAEVSQGNLGAIEFLRAHNADFVPVKEEDWLVDGRSPFSNINTPEEFEDLNR